MKRKIFPFILLLTFFRFSICVSASDANVIIPDKSLLTDNQYMISIDIAGNEGFVSAQIEIKYNKDVVECQKIIAGDVLEGMLTDTNPAAKGEKMSAILSAAGTVEISKNGNMATFVFSKPKDGNPGFEFIQFDLINASGEKLDCTVHIQNEYGNTIDTSEEIFATPKPTKPSGGSSGRFDGSVGSNNIEKPTPTTNVPPPLGDDQITIHDKENITTIHKSIFSDVTNNHWANEYINQAADMGIVSGYEDGTFLPDKEMTRAEFATVLWNIAGKPVVEDSIIFEDVAENDWFYKPVSWAYKNGYISGVSETEFAPDENITREQITTILYRYKGYTKTKTVIDTFDDFKTVSDYAVDAMNWAVSGKIISGTTDTTLSPKSSATRAQLAAIMVRMLNK